MQSISKYLKSIGVNTVFFGCGGRNESLLTSLEGFDQKLFIDERAGSFAALGLAKVKREPVAFCVTSGTAVAECLPAMIEAYYSNIPLIILSADRPDRLQGTNAPQTIVQKDIFSMYSRTYLELNLEENMHNHEVLFPMHINIKIDDRQMFENSFKERELTNISSQELFKKLDSSKASVIIICENSNLTDDQVMEMDNHNFPLYIECLSKHNNLVLKNRIYFDKQIRALLNSKKIDLVIKIGNTPVTGVWRDLDREFLNIDVVSINSKTTGLARGYLASYPKLLPTKKMDFLPDDLRELFNKFCQKYQKSEPSIIKSLAKRIDEEDVIYLGNSMPIRLWQLVNSKHNKIFASRGANGIDGQLSTAIGMAYGINQPVHCILGDLTFLYDMNMIMEKWPSNLKVYVLNNQGGGIFRRVSVNPKMIYEHKINFDAIVKLTPNIDQVEVLNSDNYQTEAFWNDWQKS